MDFSYFYTIGHLKKIPLQWLGQMKPTTVVVIRGGLDDRLYPCGNSPGWLKKTWKKSSHLGVKWLTSWLVEPTHLKHILLVKIGSFPQVGLNIFKFWNYHPVIWWWVSSPRPGVVGLLPNGCSIPSMGRRYIYLHEWLVFNGKTLYKMDPYCWWKKTGEHQLRLVVYPII